MKKISNLIFLSPLLALACLEAAIVYPRYIYACLLLMNFFVVATIYVFKHRCQIGGRLINFLILPLLVSNCASAYSVLLNNKALIQSVFLLSAILLYLYFRFVYFYLVKPHLYTPSSIENISSYGNLFVVFWLSSFIYGLQSFLNVDVWKLAVVALLAFFLVIYQVLWANNIPKDEKMIYSVVGSLLLVELVWIVSLLPFNYNVSGFVMAICYYMMIGIMRLHLIGKMSAKSIKLYLIYGFASIILVLLTAQWI